MTPDLASYDYVIVALSGGKDSVACLLYLLELGVHKSKIECWHHLVDGRENPLLFDWECTEDYVRVLCQALGIKLYYSWRSGGLEREMLRYNLPTAATFFETPEGLKTAGGGSNKLGTRLRFPQLSAGMSTRWCSSYGKIGVADAAINNQSRFKGKRTLVITGERRQESSARSKYLEFESHRTHCQSRHVDHWRPVIDWSSEDTFIIAQKYSLLCHPCYYLGFGRASCQMCIFASDDQLASVYKIAPHKVNQIAEYERQFSGYWQQKEGKTYTIHRTLSVMERVARGKPFDMKDEDIKLAVSPVYYKSVIVPPSKWEMPMGAFSKDTAGPT
ncbi:phosphoadenosine phosphosulfate reductase [Nostoc linckia z7]|uniref:Phosphoadenosine phosphosulfate reductase n=2 Tax=Nostoc linckia TaxID=92942 RepID=A0A9Q5ZGG3_NOSLI|nr:phosphoadenosine phosphosulfate reductase family protein [Nostoc linckia]PHK42883.1 phosphoadenosine phosphosulfate reductase [Nostoc linckia z15]PHK48040.1 phosphoadenosine phosphosulfate reductase [Nostoc linckia z16]PHJ64960.1 phosphoadenosine phosphosulfate reductase [Nostoc linckia z1]PHJ70138.1 phosphoadenosine phosphosulfate reductase [Nostoc linckia z3]PHJ75039.1 phosphoadenosine phosphosulfate reductase [Nostoc linckia z2]